MAETSTSTLYATSRVDVDAWLFEQQQQDLMAAQRAQAQAERATAQEEVSKSAKSSVDSPKEPMSSRLPLPTLSNTQTRKLMDDERFVELEDKVTKQRSFALLQPLGKDATEFSFNTVKMTSDGHFKFGATQTQSQLNADIVQMRHGSGYARPEIKDGKIHWTPVSTTHKPPVQFSQQDAARMKDMPGVITVLTENNKTHFIQMEPVPDGSTAIYGKYITGVNPDGTPQVPDNAKLVRVDEQGENLGMHLASGERVVPKVTAGKLDLSEKLIAENEPSAAETRGATNPSTPSEGTGKPVRFHVMQTGDTLWELARANNTTVAKIQAVNEGLVGANGFVRLGQKVILPDDATPNTVLAGRHKINIAADKTLVAQTDIDQLRAELKKYPPLPHWDRAIGDTQHASRAVDPASTRHGKQEIATAPVRLKLSQPEPAPLYAPGITVEETERSLAEAAG